MSPAARQVVQVTPLALLGVFVVLLALPVTRDTGKWLLTENRPVELATFVFLLAAGLISLYLVVVARRRGGSLLTQLFYAAFGIALILVSGEEVAWGQYWLGFEPPALLAELNVKGEATVHNIEGLNGRTEILRVLYGVGGLVGVWLHPVSYTHLTLPTTLCMCRSRWSPYH